MHFLRRWILPPLIALVYWLWSRTWRFKVIETPAMSAALRNGPVVFAHWHGDEMVVLRLGRHYRCSAMTSTSDDGELMTRVLKIFGFGISRGSSTRGGVRALVGMIKLMRDEHYNGTVAVDGPKGPRHKVKPGVIALSHQVGAPIIPTGVTCNSALVFKRSWNKTYLPWPLAKVIVCFGEPVMPAAVMPSSEADIMGATEFLETRLQEEKTAADALLSGAPLERL